MVGLKVVLFIGHRVGIAKEGRKMISNIFTVIGASVVIVFIILLISLFSTFLWFCFDDALAALCGIPALGTQSWYHVWPFTMFVASLFKTSIASK